MSKLKKYNQFLYEDVTDTAVAQPEVKTDNTEVITKLFLDLKNKVAQKIAENKKNRHEKKYDVYFRFCSSDLLPKRRQHVSISAGDVLTICGFLSAMPSFFPSAIAHEIRNPLGAISHALTALAALKARGVEVAGLVVNETQASPVSLEATLDALARFAPQTPSFSLRWGGNASADLVQVAAAALRG